MLLKRMRMYDNKLFCDYLESISKEFIEFSETNTDLICFISVSKNQYGKFSKVWCNTQPLDSDPHNLNGYGSHSLQHSEQWVVSQWVDFKRLDKFKKILNKSQHIMRRIEIDSYYYIVEETLTIDKGDYFTSEYGDGTKRLNRRSTRDHAPDWEGFYDFNGKKVYNKVIETDNPNINQI